MGGRSPRGASEGCAHSLPASRRAPASDRGWAARYPASGERSPRLERNLSWWCWVVPELCAVARRMGARARARGVRSALTLLVARVVTDDHDPAVAPDDPALVTDLLDARLDLHRYALLDRAPAPPLPTADPELSDGREPEPSLVAVV